MADEGPQCEIEVDFSNISDICLSTPRRLLVTGILIQWMRFHFTEAENIESELLQDYLWTNNISTTGIVIDSVFKFNPSQTESRPGIFVKPGAWRNIRVGIDNRHMPTTDLTNMNPTYTTFYQGSHTLFAISGESAECEILASEILREIEEFSPVARKVFSFMRIGVSDLGEVSILEESNENFVCPVVISYAVADSWGICRYLPELEMWKNSSPELERLQKGLDKDRMKK